MLIEGIFLFRCSAEQRNKSIHLLFGLGGGLSRSNSPGLRVFCDASHLYHKKHFVRNSRMTAPPPQPLDVSLCRVEHGNLTKAMAAWCMSESRTQNFRDTLFLYHENSSTGL